MTEWQKSSFSGNGPDNNCVEAAAESGVVSLRESDAPGVVVTATPRAFGALIRGIKEGEFGHLR
ncbi:DUF397 domain-containing protein [Streptomyces xinghaiensis]|uniref:DUF397 domain-containing protein n=1 Tax=Streptomyces xinghaiensis TaxID=1038928 RepID=UPI002E104AB4|nr:DUF397 domain-containing protein [Streptomyces xinghaiensis]